MKDIYLAENYTLLKAEYRQCDMHQHMAEHVVLGKDKIIECQIGNGEKFRCQGVIIGSCVPHTIDSGGFSILVFLIDTTSGFAMEVRRLLQENDYYVIDQQQCQALLKAWEETEMSTDKNTL